MFNEALLRKGLAQVYTVPPNDEYEGRFFDAQDRVASAGLGIWGLSYGRQLRQNDRGNGVGGDGCSPLAPEPPPQYRSGRTRPLPRRIRRPSLATHRGGRPRPQGLR